MKNNEETSYRPSLEKESIRSSEGNMSQTGHKPEGSLTGQGSDEVKENMKEKVAKGVAAVAGALEGFANEAREADLPQKTKEAIDKAGETAKQATDATKKQVDRMKGGSSGSGSSGTSYQRATSGSSTADYGSSGSTSSMDR